MAEEDSIELLAEKARLEEVKAVKEKETTECKTTIVASLETWCSIPCPSATMR
jgi:hypothetical protein